MCLSTTVEKGFQAFESLAERFFAGCSQCGCIFGSPLPALHVAVHAPCFPGDYRRGARIPRRGPDLYFKFGLSLCKKRAFVARAPQYSDPADASAKFSDTGQAFLDVFQTVERLAYNH